MATALITGAAARLGRAIAEELHRDHQVVIHYRRSAEAAQTLAANLNARRPGSAATVQSDLGSATDCDNLASAALACFGELSVLVNNASAFYPTPIGEADEQQWDELMGSNLKAPFFLSQALAPALAEQRGCIVNLADIHAEKPMPTHTVYCAAKAGLAMLTKSLARELAPQVRVNGVAPGAILWPEQESEGYNKEQILARIPMQRSGDPSDIARTVRFLAVDAPYITGQIIAVDGGRSLNI
ncbi:pteridine reductase [Microbulbifer hydrolyticus]|uniref:Pteridine reductase n=1 Tax=Microbulbifer hydrolyticus TaxID=48074 RepID=A0A6P1TFM5_9GAMM|nr:pteridine reductase [Microbulbifer hydrolyticus]MBB5212983.1 pteridine reductase [Microbulbifer hydrolyticus]QHQ40350.1 pteridine reductase [Microbulbifer hydrolyticus]